MRPAFAILLVAGLLVGCASKVTQANYDRIKPGMAREEVLGILGQPDGTSDVTIGPLSGTSSTWTGRGNTITIQFVNDKVVTKTLDGG